MNKKPIIIKNLISNEIAALSAQTLLFDEAKCIAKTNSTYNHDNLLSVVNSHEARIHEARIFVVGEALLVKCHKQIENIIQEPLLPTYSFSRVYRNGSELFEHVDRGACEVSVSIQLATHDIFNKNGWPLKIGKKNYYLNNGDGIIYSGQTLKHSRPKLLASPTGFHIQTFLHYVRANGRFAEYVFDGRMGVGLDYT